MKTGGRVGFAEGSTDFDKKVKEYQDMGMELKDAIDEAVKDFTEGRKDFVTGGLSESIKEVQEETKRATQPLRETIADVCRTVRYKSTREVLDDTAKVLNKNERPAQFRTCIRRL